MVNCLMMANWGSVTLCDQRADLTSQLPGASGAGGPGCSGSGVPARGRRAAVVMIPGPLGSCLRHRGAIRGTWSLGAIEMVGSVPVREAGSRGGPEIFRFAPPGFGEQPEQHHDQCRGHEGD